MRRSIVVSTTVERSEVLSVLDRFAAEYTCSAFTSQAGASRQWRITVHLPDAPVPAVVPSVDADPTPPHGIDRPLAFGGPYPIPFGVMVLDPDPDPRPAYTSTTAASTTWESS